jgi:hypothetical protein
MAYGIEVLDVSYEAAENLSGDQFTFVVLDSGTGRVRRPDSAAEIPDGILQNKPVSGEEALVRKLGLSKLAVNGAVSIGDFLKAEYVGAADAGKGEKAAAAWRTARAVVLEAAGAEGDLATVELVGPFPPSLGTLIGFTTVSTIATADVVIYTAAQILGGLVLRDPNGAGRSDVTPDAAEVIAAMAQAGVGNCFEFTIRNTANAAETITVTAGAGVTLSGTMTIAQDHSKRFLCVVTGAATMAVYSLGTVVH